MKTITIIVIAVGLLALVLMEYALCCNSHDIEEEIDKAEMCRTLRENEICGCDCEHCYWRGGYRDE